MGTNEKIVMEVIGADGKKVAEYVDDGEDEKDRKETHDEPYHQVLEDEMVMEPI